MAKASKKHLHIAVIANLLIHLHFIPYHVFYPSEVHDGGQNLAMDSGKKIKNRVSRICRWVTRKSSYWKHNFRQKPTAIGLVTPGGYLQIIRKARIGSDQEEEGWAKRGRGVREWWGRATRCEIGEGDLTRKDFKRCTPPSERREGWTGCRWDDRADQNHG